MVKFLSFDSELGKISIGNGFPCFVVAEMSANHNGNLQQARSIIHGAASSGANAIKLQTYLPSTMTIDCDNEYFKVQSKTGPQDWNKSLYTLYQSAYTPWEWHKELKELTESLGMIFFSTPFDPTSVDFLEDLNVPLYKVASYELTDLPLLKKIASTKKPIILSTGFASLEEITQAVQTLRDSNVEELALLYCVTNYSDNPDYETTNLSTIQDLAKRFNVVVGFSDNTGGIDIPLQAVNCGASILEKHIKLDEDFEATDASFSISLTDFRELVLKIRQQESVFGEPFYGVRNENEAYFRNFRRSIFIIRDMVKGEIFTDENIRVIRPAYGLEPKHYEEILGKKAKFDIPRGTPLDWDNIN